MKQNLYLIGVILLVVLVGIGLLFATGIVAAQEATEEAVIVQPFGYQPPVVTQALPDEPTRGEWIDTALDLVESLAVIIALFWIYKSVPLDAVDKLLDQARSAANRTASDVDDRMVTVARMLFDWSHGRLRADAETVSPDALYSAGILSAAERDRVKQAGPMTTTAISKMVEDTPAREILPQDLQESPFDAPHK